MQSRQLALHAPCKSLYALNSAFQETVPVSANGKGMRESDSNHLLFKKCDPEAVLTLYGLKLGYMAIPCCRGGLEMWKPLDGCTTYIQLNLERERKGIKILLLLI